MNALRAINRLTLLLLLVAGTLGYGVFVLWQQQLNAASQQLSDSVQPGQVVRGRMTSNAGAGYVPPPLSVFNEIVERPLFEQDRTRPELPVEEKTAVPRSPLNLRLEGVAIVADKGVALVRDLNTKELYRLQVGMEHQGWTVANIDVELAEFKRGDETHQLVLEVEPSSNSRAHLATQRLRSMRRARPKQ